MEFVELLVHNCCGRHALAVFKKATRPRSSRRAPSRGGCLTHLLAWWQTNMVRMGLVAAVDVYLDLSSSLIYLENGHTAWASISFTIFGINSLNSCFWTTFMAIELERKQEGSLGSLVYAAPLAGLLNLTPLLLAARVATEVDDDKLTAEEMDEGMKGLMMLAFLEATMEGIPQLVLQSYALAASYLEGQGAFETETEETLLWCSIATSLLSVAGLVTTLRLTGLKSVFGDDLGYKARMCQIHRVSPALLQLMSLLQTLGEVSTRTVAVCVFVMAFKGIGLLCLFLHFAAVVGVLGFMEGGAGVFLGMFLFGPINMLASWWSWDVENGDGPAPDRRWYGTALQATSTCFMLVLPLFANANARVVDGGGVICFTSQGNGTLAAGGSPACVTEAQYGWLFGLAASSLLMLAGLMLYDTGDKVIEDLPKAIKDADRDKIRQLCLGEIEPGDTANGRKGPDAKVFPEEATADMPEANKANLMPGLG